MKLDSKADSLRVFTHLTGAISDIHIKNLKAYPIVFLDEVLSHEMTIDIENQKITFDIKFPRGKVDQERPHYERLETAVQLILGAAWKVYCVSKKKTIFEGTKREEIYNVEGTILKVGDASSE